MNALMPLNMQIRRFANQFREQYAGAFKRDTGRLIEVGAELVPVLSNGGAVLNLDFSLPDRFLARTGVASTIFVRRGADFIRISTSVKKENGERAVGTLLDRSHAGYRALLQGRAYAGYAHLFGQQYITQYDPILDADGNVIAVLYVGINISARRQMGVGVKVSLIAFGLIGAIFLAYLLAIGAAMNALVSVPGSSLAAQISALQLKYGLLALLATSVAAGALFLLLRGMVAKPLQQAMRAAQQLAQGDLTTQVHVGRLDEIGRLMQAMNGVGQGLATVVGSVRRSTEQINRTSDEIAGDNDALTGHAESQASALKQTSVTMQNFTRTVDRNAERADTASRMATQASDRALAGGAVVGQVVVTMEAIRQSAHQVADIIGVIDGIAFQTNLLALNASVEAARAGVEGRGFAVVANEVRTLAQRAATAAREIKALIADAVDKVDNGSVLVDRAGQTMADIVAAVGEVTVIISDIAAASADQSRGIADVNRAIGTMEVITQHTEALVSKSAQAAEGLHRQAGQLGSEVSVFTLALDAPES